MIVRVCVARLKFNLFFIYRNPSTDDSVNDCLLESMGRIQSEDRSLYFAFVAISMGTVASGLDPRVLMYMELPLIILLHCLDALNWFMAPYIMLV